MHRVLNALVSVLIVGSVGAGMPASAVPSANESKPIVNGEVTPRPDPISVKLRLVKDRSERARILSLLRGLSVAVPLSGPLPHFDPKGGFGPCELQTEDIHARKSANFSKIGPKPTTKCTHRVDVIIHRTNLEYMAGGTWRRVPMEFNDLDTNLSIHVSLDIAHPCQGRDRTKWKSETTSTVIDGGNYYRATVHSIPRFIACGA